jgi:Flp pilus assembly protein TadG
MGSLCTSAACRTRHEMAAVKAGRELASARSFWRERDGVSAVEFAFVLPIVILLLGGIFQFGFALFMQGHMSGVARETSRYVAVGEFNESEARSFAESSLINPGVTYDIAVTPPDPDDPTDRVVTVSITAPLAELSPIDILGLFKDSDLTASVQRRMEFTE